MCAARTAGCRRAAGRHGSPHGGRRGGERLAGRRLRSRGARPGGVEVWVVTPCGGPGGALTHIAQPTMAAPRWGVATPSTFRASLVDFAAAPAPAPKAVLFTSDTDAASGVPWCPDCARAVPAVRRAIAATGGSLLEVEANRGLAGGFGIGLGGRPVSPAWPSSEEQRRAPPACNPLYTPPGPLNLHTNSFPPDRAASRVEGGGPPTQVGRPGPRVGHPHPGAPGARGRGGRPPGGRAGGGGV